MTDSRKKKKINPNGTIFTYFNQYNYRDQLGFFCRQGACAGFTITNKLGPGMNMYKATNAQLTLECRVQGANLRARFFGRNLPSLAVQTRWIASMYAIRHKGALVTESPYLGNPEQSAEYFRKSSNNYSKRLAMIVGTPVFPHGSHALSITSEGNGQCTMRDSNMGKLKGDCTAVYLDYKWALADCCKYEPKIVSVAVNIPPLKL